MAETTPTPSSRIQWARTTIGLSSRELDRLAGLGEGHTSLIETGRRKNISTETAASIARVLGVSLDWLVLGRGRNPTIKHLVASAAVAREAQVIP